MHCKCSSEQLNCTQFDPLILNKIVKIVATRCHILRLKWPNTASAGPGWWGSLQRSLRPLAGFKGSHISKGTGEGREKGDKKGGEGKGKEDKGKGRGGEGKGRRKERWEGIAPTLLSEILNTPLCVLMSISGTCWWCISAKPTLKAVCSKVIDCLVLIDRCGQAETKTKFDRPVLASTVQAFDDYLYAMTGEYM